jgi:hypothetical protein
MSNFTFKDKKRAMIRRARFYSVSTYFAENSGQCILYGIKMAKKVETNIGKPNGFN